MKKILIFGAHLDDAEFGMGGTIAKLTDYAYVSLCVFCRGDRPGFEHVQNYRQQAIEENVKSLRIDNLIQYDYSDITLDSVPFIELSSTCTALVNDLTPDVVFTHYSNDINIDHRIVSDATRVACRPREGCSVKELYEYSIPGSTEWSHSSPNFNTFFDISEYLTVKYECVSRYSTELKSDIDPLNLDYIKHRDCYYGGLYGVRAAEPFINIYSRK
jgi:LmbE family N-acetylglucosaminyl deacetylase